MGNCRADWAMSITTAIEGQVKTQWNNSRLLKFSEKYLVDCFPQESACDGVAVTDALAWMEDNNISIPRSYQHPYNEVEGTCPSDLQFNGDSWVGVVNHQIYTEPSAEALYELLSQNGPLIGEIIADKSKIDNYTSGSLLTDCFDNIQGNEEIYYVNIVGYHYKPWAGEKAWRVKFPFGTGWGHEGYAYIPVVPQDVDGLCGVRQQVITVQITPEVQA